MHEQELIDIIVEYALNYLYEDDINPDVGLGMRIQTAINLAERQIMKENIRWNPYGIFFETHFTKTVEEEAAKRIFAKRKR